VTGKNHTGEDAAGLGAAVGTILGHIDKLTTD
jgi:hypothetical protein